MIGIDTNILVRLLTYDDPAQAEAASSRVTFFLFLRRDKLLQRLIHTGLPTSTLGPEIR